MLKVVLFHFLSEKNEERKTKQHAQSALASEWWEYWQIKICLTPKLCLFLHISPQSAIATVLSRQRLIKLSIMWWKHHRARKAIPEECYLDHNIVCPVESSVMFKYKNNYITVIIMIPFSYHLQSAYYVYSILYYTFYILFLLFPEHPS